MGGTRESEGNTFPESILMLGQSLAWLYSTCRTRPQPRDRKPTTFLVKSTDQLGSRRSTDKAEEPYLHQEKGHQLICLSCLFHLICGGSLPF